MKLFQIRTWVIAGLLTFSVFLLVRLATPSYPVISQSASLEQVKKFILKVAKIESRNNSYEALDTPSHGLTVEQINAGKKYIQELDRCKDNKKCLIDTYEKNMNNWTSDSMRKQTRALYMIKKFGIVGEQLNEAIGFMY